MKRLKISRVGIPTAIAVIIPLILNAGWMRTYGGEYGDYGKCIQRTTDDCYVIVGMTGSFGSQAGKQSAWFLKINEYGDTLWTRTYRDAGCARGSYTIQTSDDGYIIVGLAYTDTMETDLALIKTDANGDTLWTRVYGKEGWDEGVYLQETSDGGYIVIGEIESSESIYRDIWLLRLDSLGDTIWTQTYGKEYDDSPRCLVITDDGGYIISASLGYLNTDEGLDFHDIWILRTDSLGDTLWTKTYGYYEQIDWGRTIQSTDDNHYLMSGSSAGNLWLLKFDSLGDTLWTRTYEDGGAGSLQPTDDGGYILTGVINSITEGDWDLWLVKINSDADTIWTRTFGGEEYDCGFSVKQMDDRGYMIVGWTDSYGEGDSDLWLIKTDSLGYVSVEEKPILESVAGWELLTSVGSQIVLRYSDRSEGFHASIFDAAGRKVDELHSDGVSGTITWGESMSPGVYFIRLTDESSGNNTARVVIIH